MYTAADHALDYLHGLLHHKPAPVHPDAPITFIGETMHPATFQSVSTLIEQLLLTGSQAIAPTAPGVSADIQLGVLIFALVGQLFHHVAQNPPVAAPVTPAA